MIYMFPRIFAAVGDACSFSSDPGSSFLGLPKWYKYLKGQQSLTLDIHSSGVTVCSPHLNTLSDVWLIAAAVTEMLLRIAAFAAIVYVIYGGVQFMLSQGDPGKTAQARTTVISAVVGLTISVVAAGVVTFIAGRFS